MESDDEADLKKIVDILKVSKEDSSTQLQYQEFFNFNNSDDEEEFEPHDSNINNDDNDHFDEAYKIDISKIYKYSPNASLKSEEKAVIDSCRDLELKSLLILNRQKNLQLIQLYKKFKDLLIECKQNLVDKKLLVTQYFDAHKVQSQSSGSWRVGAPYFKDKRLYEAPSNDDVLRKKANNELSYYDFQIPKKWSKFEYDRLIKSVKFNYNLNQICEVKRNIKQLTNSDDPEKDCKVQELEIRLKELDNMDNLEVPPLGSDHNINWIRVTETFIKDKYSDFECRSCWNMVAHPFINKSKWTAKENKQLLSLVRKYECQNWIKIAEELGTNRSCLLVCQHYFSNFHDGFKKGEFTANEDRKLLQLVNEYKIGNIIPWTKISRHFKNRSRIQLHHRFIYYLNQSDKKRGKFSDAEDVIILLCVNKFGRHFTKFAEYLPDRSVSQIKTRYTSSLKSVVKKGAWSIKEDKQLYDFVQKYGAMWTQLSKQEEMHRTAGQLRQRYITICQYFKLHPQARIEDVPRRKNHLCNNIPDKSELLNEVVSRFMDSPLIPSLREVEDMIYDIKEVPFVKVESCIDDVTEEKKPFTDIDSLLTEFFCNNSDREDKVVSRSVLKKTVEEIELIMDVLKTNLHIPEDLSNFPMLDNLDKDILKELRTREYTHKSNQISKAIPPNFFSTTGIRSLLIKNYKFINSPKDRIFSPMEIPQSVKIRIKSKMDTELSHMNPSEKRVIELDRSLFYRRFLSLFKWPSILTLDDPSRELLSITKHCEHEFRPPLKRTYSKIKNNEETVGRKKMRVLEDNPKELLKLTPVTDKSIIMNLIEDTSKKLFQLNTVQCGQETKTLIEEVDVRNIQSTSKTSIKKVVKAKKPKVFPLKISNRGKKMLNLEYDPERNHRKVEKLKPECANSNSILENVSVIRETDIIEADDNDLMDLQKLTAFIKAEKHRE